VDVFVVTNEQQGQQYQYNPQTRHRNIRLPKPTSFTNDLINHAVPLAEQLYQPGKKYLKAGVMLGHLVPDESLQGNLFFHSSENQHRILMDAIDNINFSQRDDAVKYVASGLKRNWKMRQELRSKRFTTRWDELYEVS
jgi:DNA polymerase V